MSANQESSTPNRTNQRPQPWPAGIVPYVLSNDYNIGEKRDIYRALTHISNKTNNCVQFVPRTKEPDYVLVKKEGGNGECYSRLGKIGGEQILSVGWQCGVPHGIMHEAYHVLGFDHTQCRSDRDEYIDILWSNIMSGLEVNFVMRETNNELVAFDFDSIMIYDPRTYSNNTLPTMQVKSHVNGRLSWNDERKELSKLDIEMIRRLYNCH